MKNFNNIFNQIFNNKLNATVNNYASNYALFTADKPAEMPDSKWFVSILNPNRFPFWTMKFLYLIIHLSTLFSHTIAFMDTLAVYAKKSTRTVQRVLRKLVAVGLVEEMIVDNRRLYRVIESNYNLLTGKYSGNNIIKDFYEEIAIENSYMYDYYENKLVTPDVTPPLVASPLESEGKGTFFGATKEDPNNNRYLDHQKIDDVISDSDFFEIPTSDKQLDQQDQKPDRDHDQKQKDTKPKEKESKNLITLSQEEIEIKEEFEKITGRTLNLKKNLKPMEELKELAKKSKDLVKVAFQNVAKHIEKTGAKIYNLAYIVITAKNIFNQKNNPPKTSPGSQGSAPKQKDEYWTIGKSTYAESASVVQKQADLDQPAQLPPPEEQLVNQACLQDPKLKSTLYGELTKQEKRALLEEELDIMKSDKPYWEGLLEKAQESGGRRFLVHLAIERIKYFLVLSYLHNKEPQPSFATG